MSITSAQDIRRLGRIMGVWAHPDDETLVSGGIMAAAVQNGQEVMCITATHGETGVQDEARWPRDRLAQIREKELKDALNIIGVQHHEWLHFEDGKCSEHTDEGIGSIRACIEQYQPDTILTFGPDGLTGHSDHKAVSAWVTSVCQRLKHPPTLYHVVVTHEQYDSFLRQIDEKVNIFFNIDQPHVVWGKNCEINFELSEKLKDCKYRALKAMPSQTEAMMRAFDKKFICRSLSPEAFVLAK